MNGAEQLNRVLRAGVCLLLAVLFAGDAAQFEGTAAAQDAASLIPVKMSLGTISKEDRDKVWVRIDEYATVDALMEFCGRKNYLQGRTWKVVSPCIETSSLRKVAAVFRAKKEKYMKAWETTHPEPEKRKALCDGLQPKLNEYKRVLDAHIAEADSLCRACLFC
jgi:hypothetical protein